MLKKKCSIHTVSQRNDTTTEQPEVKTAQYVNAVLKAYEIVPDDGDPSSSQEKSVNLKTSQNKRKGSDSFLSLKNETANHKGNETDLMNKKTHYNSFAMEKPSHSCHTLAEFKTDPETKWKGSDSLFSLKNETANRKGTENDLMNKKRHNSFAIKQPSHSCHPVAEFKTAQSKSDVFKAYGLMKFG